MIAVRRLNHAVLFVSDLDRAVQFYRDILGMQVIAREPRANAAFLRASGELAAAREVLLAAGASGGESSHGATKSLYGADPDGNQFEIMWLLPRGDWGDYESAATVDRLDLPAELSRWSGVSTA